MGLTFNILGLKQDQDQDPTTHLTLENDHAKPLHAARVQAYMGLVFELRHLLVCVHGLVDRVRALGEG